MQPDSTLASPSVLRSDAPDLGRRSVLLLLALATLPHLQALRIGFLHDDLFNYLHTFRFSGVVAGMASAWAPEPGGGFYRPLVEASYGINYALFGAHPFGFRLTDLLLHAVATLLAARLAVRLTGGRGAGLAVGTLVALHPLPVRAVYWTSDRYVIVASIFTFLAVLSFVRWRAGGGRRYLVLALLGQVAGVLCKESAAAIAPAIFVVDLFWGAGQGRERRARRASRIILGVLPFVVIDAIYLGFRYLAFGDLGGYRGDDGSILLPIGPVRVLKEILFDVPYYILFPINRLQVSGPVRAGLVAALGLLFLVLAAGAWMGRKDRAAGRLRHVLGGLALGYVMLIPSLPYFYLGRDLLKAYHLYPSVLGFGIAAWAGLATRRSRAPFALLLTVYVVVAQFHVRSWIQATEITRSFSRWVAALEPPVGPSTTLWVTGVPPRWRGALVIEMNQMQKCLEVLLDWRLGRAQGLGYPWCKASVDEVRSTLRAGARFLEWDAATSRGSERTDALNALIRGRKAPRDLIAGGVAVAPATWGAEGRAVRIGDRAAWRIHGRKGRLRWTGPAFGTEAFAEAEVRIRLVPAGGTASGAAVSANLRWTDRHYSEGGLHRLARIPAIADGRWHTHRIDFVRTGWVGDRVRVGTLTLSPGRSTVEIEVSSLRLIPW